MSVRSLNGLGGSTNVYVNTNLSATEPVVVNQTSFTNPVVVSLKGLSGFGSAGQIIKVNSTANSLEYGDNNDYWTLSSNNLRPNNTSDRVIIGDTTSFTTGTGLTLKGASNGFYTNGILDINRTAGNTIYLACDKGAGRSNDIYFGDANSNTGSTDGVLLRQETDTSDNHTFKINSVASGANTDRVNIDMPATNDTFLKVQSSTNAYLELKENDNNRVDLRYEVGSPNDSFKNVFYHTDGNQSIFNYNHSVNSSSRELIFYPKTEFDSDVLLNHTGGVGKASKLIFVNDTNTTTFSFEYSENTENFSFKKTNSTLWDYDSSNSPAKLTMYALFKFNTTTFQNSTNQTITLPTSAGTLALISDITAANYWSLSSNTLKTAQTTYNILLGKSSASSGNPKLDILGNAVIDGDVSLTGTFKCEDHFAVNHSNPYTYIYDPTGYSVSNPYFRFHTNGTDLLLNLPSNQGSSSSFRFFTGNSAELMRLDAARTLKVFGASSAKLELSNDDGLSSSSSIHFTNDVDSQKYFMEFKPSQASDSFNFKYDTGVAETGLLNYNTSTERLTIGKNLLLKTEDSGNTNLILTCGTTTGNGSIIVFGDTSDEDKYTFGYEKTSGGGRLAITDAAGTPQITYDSSVSEFDIGSTTLKTSGVIKNGSLTFTLPSSTGTLALTSQLGGNVFNTSGTTMTADPQANNSEITTQFKISSGAGSNGDCVLLIEADTNDSVEASNPEIRLRADGGNTGVNMKMDNNDFRIETTYSGQNIVLNPYSGANVDINAGLTSCSDQFDCATSRFRIQRISSLTYFYNPSGTHSGGGSASYSGSYWSYHDNGTAIYFNLPSGSTSAGAYYGFATSNSQKARIDMSGSGKITGSWTGGWSGTSDRRLKKNIVPIENAVDTLMKINVYQFDKYDIDNFDCIHHDEDEDTLKPFTERLSKDTRFVYGFIAQELCENTPEIGKMCVETNGWGEEEPAYIIDDRPILACAIKTIQTQQEEINTLRQEVNNLTNIINKLIESPSFKSFKQKLE